MQNGGSILTPGLREREVDPAGLILGKWSCIITHQWGEFVPQTVNRSHLIRLVRKSVLYTFGGQKAFRNKSRKYVPVNSNTNVLQ